MRLEIVSMQSVLNCLGREVWGKMFCKPWLQICKRPPTFLSADWMRRQSSWAAVFFGRPYNGLYIWHPLWSVKNSKPVLGAGTNSQEQGPFSQMLTIRWESAPGGTRSSKCPSTKIVCTSASELFLNLLVEKVCAQTHSFSVALLCHTWWQTGMHWTTDILRLKGLYSHCFLIIRWWPVFNLFILQIHFLCC